MSIRIQNISKHFGSFAALDQVSLDIQTGELVALLGPSGSGKTTLLRVIAGLERPDPDSGAILFHDQDVADRSVTTRGVGFVFQHYALFKHMTVFENVAFGLRVRPWQQRPSRREIRERVQKLLALVQLEWLANRYPSQLSGGQKQRVALARALAVEPKVLLLDEPFGALDAKVRQELRQWLRRLHDEIHVTSVFVTHDQEDALEVADRVVIMNQGRIVQIGTPEEVFNHPANEFVMNFLGTVNVFQGRLETGRAFFGPLEVDPSSLFHNQAGRAARAFIRPHELEVNTHKNGQPSFRARVIHINAAGPQAKLLLESENGESVQVEMPRDRFQSMGIKRGDDVYVSPKNMRVFMEDYVI